MNGNSNAIRKTDWVRCAFMREVTSWAKSIRERVIIVAEREGVIKYRLGHRQTALPDDTDIRELNAWRSIFYQLKLIGGIAEKYDGLGFGNLSRRLVPGKDEFIITGSQTGHLAVLGKEHYAIVRAASPEENSIQSLGSIRPSSEALTHAGVYRLDAGIQAVIHVHSPELWQNTDRLRLPSIPADIPYGTPEMARAVQALFDSGGLRDLPLFSMLGHEDGLVAFGSTLADAAVLLITMLARARG